MLAEPVGPPGSQGNGGSPQGLKLRARRARVQPGLTGRKPRPREGRGGLSRSVAGSEFWTQKLVEHGRPLGPSFPSSGSASHSAAVPFSFPPEEGARPPGPWSLGVPVRGPGGKADRGSGEKGRPCRATRGPGLVPPGRGQGGRPTPRRPLPTGHTWCCTPIAA